MPVVDKRKKREREESRMNCGITYVLEDLDRAFSDILLKKITSLYEKGYSAEKIGEQCKRDPDEIVMALFHQSRQGKTEKPFAYRI